jgi:hypothetical protein
MKAWDDQDMLHGHSPRQFGAAGQPPRLAVSLPGGILGPTTTD